MQTLPLPLLSTGVAISMPRTMLKCYIGTAMGEWGLPYLGEASIREILVWNQLFSNDQVQYGQPRP